jgi:hypothetical protein
MATFYNAQSCRAEDNNSLQFETSNFDLFKMVENACRVAVDTDTEVKKAECGYKEVRCMDFDHTIDMMRSPDYKERFKAEYYQTKIRYEKLHKMVIKAESGTLGFEPTCSLDLLMSQKRYMGEYLHCLEVRAEIEHIDL